MVKAGRDGKRSAMTRAEIIATVDQHMDAAMLKVHADLLAAVASGDFDLEAGTVRAAQVATFDSHCN